MPLRNIFRKTRLLSKMDWRALLDSNQWPSASECEVAVLTDRTSGSHPVANRGLRSNGGAPNVSLRPADPENFAASLLPSSALTPGLRALAESAPSLISPQDAAHRLGVCR